MVDLSVRRPELVELMDDPDCDLEGLRRTYAQFRLVNRVVAGWHRVYRRRIRPLLSPEVTSSWLDIGSGAGDIPRAVARWAARDGLRLEVTALDPDERAYAYATEQPTTPGVTYRRGSSAELVAAGETFDIVTSNHLLHHLDHQALLALLGDSERLARRLVVHNDIERRGWAYAAYAVAARPVARGSFLLVDGLRSIRRSYRPEELAALVGPPWTVESQWPARLLLVREIG